MGMSNTMVSDTHSNRKYQFNQHYLDVIDTEEKAYLLGFLWTDGNNNMTRGIITLELSSIDVELLTRVRLLFGDAAPLYYRASRPIKAKNGKIFTHADMYGLRLSSISLCRHLSSVGMLPNKTTTLRWPTIPIRPDLVRHFVRGLFDGDGSICLHLNKGKTRPQALLCFYAKNIGFANDTRKAIYESTGIDMATRKAGSIHRLMVSSRPNVHSILTWLYGDASIYLERKHVKYLETERYYELMMQDKGRSSLSSGPSHK